MPTEVEEWFFEAEEIIWSICIIILCAFVQSSNKPNIVLILNDDLADRSASFL